jgi:hypothetical protein
MGADAMKGIASALRRKSHDGLDDEGAEGATHALGRWWAAVRRVLDVWWTWTLNGEHEDGPTVTHETIQQARNVSLMALGGLLFLLPLLGSTVALALVGGSVPALFRNVPLGVAALVASILLNRSHRSRAASWLLVVMTNVAVADVLLLAPLGEAALVHVPALYFLATSSLIAGILLPVESVVFVAASNGALIVLDVVLQSRLDPSGWLALGHGGLTALLGPLLAFHLLVAGVTLAWTRTTWQAKERVSVAEHTADILSHEAQRGHEEARQRQALEESIRIFVPVLSQLATQPSRARVPLPQQGEPLVITSIRTGLEDVQQRVAALSRANEMLEQERAQVERLLTALRAPRDERGVEWPEPAGVPVDGLIAALAGSGVFGPRGRTRDGRGSGELSSGTLPRTFTSGQLPSGSGSLRPGSGPLPPGSGPLPPRSGPLPPGSGALLYGGLYHPGSGPLPSGSGPLPPESGGLRWSTPADPPPDTRDPDAGW